MKTYELGLAIVIFSTFFYFVAAVDRATDSGAKELTKANLVKELSPITTANHKNYN